MAHLIDKSVVVAEIERKINEINLDTIEDWRYRLQREHDIEVMKNVLSFLDTIETKEVDLEKEISDYLTSYHLHIKDGGRVVFDNDDSPNFMCDTRHIAKHFYELGLNARKED